MTNPNQWTSYSIALGTLAPGVYQIRFAETDNVFSFNMGIDNVQVASNVPGPIVWTGSPSTSRGTSPKRAKSKSHTPVLVISL
jgi:hypothetical protein